MPEADAAVDSFGFADNKQLWPIECGNVRKLYTFSQTVAIEQTGAYGINRSQPDIRLA